MDLVDDMWEKIIGHTIEPGTKSPPRYILGLYRISRYWSRLTGNVVQRLFRTLVCEADRIDEACLMRYPLDLLELQRSMDRFCQGMGLKPWRVLCLVEPAWHTERISLLDQFRATSVILDYIEPVTSKRIRPWKLGADLIDKDRWNILTQPWLFDDAWSAYMLALFLESGRGDQGFQACADLAGDRLCDMWEVDTSVRENVVRYYGGEPVGFHKKYIESLVSTYPSVNLNGMARIATFPNETIFALKLIQHAKSLNVSFKLKPSIQTLLYAEPVLERLPDIRVCAQEPWEVILPPLGTLKASEVSGLYSLIGRYFKELMTDSCKQAIKKALGFQ